MKKQYTQKDYECDRQFVSLCDANRNASTEGKLEILLKGPGKLTLYIGHESLPHKIYGMRDALIMFKDAAYLRRELLEYHLKSKGPLTADSQHLFVEECQRIIRNRVEKVFGERYRGAQKRARKYERENSEEKASKERPKQDNPDPQLRLFT